MSGCDLRKPVQHVTSRPPHHNHLTSGQHGGALHPCCIIDFFVSFFVQMLSVLVLFFIFNSIFTFLNIWWTGSIRLSRVIVHCVWNPWIQLYVHHVTGRAQLDSLQQNHRKSWLTFNVKVPPASPAWMSWGHVSSWPDRHFQQNVRLAQLMLHHVQPLGSPWIPYRWSRRWSGIWLHQQSREKQLCGARPAHSFISSHSVVCVVFIQLEKILQPLLSGSDWPHCLESLTFSLQKQHWSYLTQFGSFTILWFIFLKNGSFIHSFIF